MKKSTFNIKLPLKIVILTAFVLQIFMISFVIVFLSYKNSTKAINDISSALKREINKRIENHLISYFSVPVNINKNNANHIKNKILNYQNQEELIKTFTSQIRVFKNVNSIYFGNTAGGIANAGREAFSDTLYQIITKDFKKGTFEKHRIDQDNKRTYIVSTVENFDSTTRPWFTGAVKNQDTFWTDIYVLFTGHDIAISTSYPVYDTDSNLTGVLSTDLFLSQINNYLQSLEIGKSGHSYIIERSGFLVASSENIPVFTKDLESGRYIRHNFLDSDSDILKTASKYLIDIIHDNRLLNKESVFKHAKQKMYMLVTPFSLHENKDWLIVTVIPEDDFMEIIKKNNRITIFLIIIAVLASVLIALLISNHISKPINKLNNNIKKMIQGKWILADTDTWLLEINSLANEFNIMSDKLQTSFTNLNNEISIREEIQKNLVSEKERLSVTLKSIGDGVIITDTKGLITSMNSVAVQLTGFTLEEAVNQSIENIFKIKNEITDEVCENPVYKVLSSGSIEELSNHTSLTSKDGRIMSIADSAAPIKDNNDNVLGVILVFRDVTEKQKLLQSLHNSQKLEAIGILAGGIAHDFNNLLAGIYGFMELAGMQANNEKTTYFLSQAAASINRAKALTQQLLTFSKGGNPVKETVSTAGYIKEIINFALSGSNLSGNYYFQKDLYLIDIDKAQITQAIDNIIINSQQAMPLGGVIDIYAENISIDKTNTQNILPGNYVKIKIKDYGAGISPKIIKQIFDPFFTTKTQKHGLGLSTSYSIIKKHNGYIFAESELNSYTEISIYLPASSKKMINTANPTLIYKMGKGNIIIMDDEEILRNTYKHMLETLGYSVITTENGYQAIEEYNNALSKDIKISAMIFDLTIPGSLGGQDTVKVIRKINRDIPVFVSSGYSGDPCLANPKDFGFTDKLIKPFEMKDLSNLLNRYLNNS